MKADSAVMAVHSVGLLNVNGNRFAEVRYGVAGSTLSVLLDQPDAVASLFASADMEFEKARDAMRRGMRMRNAAWKLSEQRTNAAKLAAKL